MLGNVETGQPRFPVTSLPAFTHPAQEPYEACFRVRSTAVTTWRERAIPHRYEMSPWLRTLVEMTE